MIVFLAGFMMAAFTNPSAAAVQTTQTSEWTAWPNTVYYYSRLTGPNAPYDKYTVYITAVDKYELYINGKRIDSSLTNDNNYATIDSMTVTGSTKELLVAVKVDNLGVGNGNGLLMDIVAGADTLGTTTMKRYSVYNATTTDMQTYPAIWYYYAGDLPTDLKKTNWFSFNSAFMDSAKANGLFDVINGKMGKINYTPRRHIEVVAGYYGVDSQGFGGVESGAAEGGGISLRTIDGQNLALKKPCPEEKVTDGDIQTGKAYHEDPTTADSISVYLEDYYRINKVRLYTGGTNPQDWPADSPRGFYIYTSNDNSSLTQRAVMSNAGISNADNGGYDYGEVTFTPIYCRYINYSITETRTDYPHVGEMMVFGTGYTYSGKYLSSWIDFGSSTTLKNFGTVTWEGITPANTYITIQTQTVGSDGVVSEWSSEHSAKSFNFDSPEPAVKFRYRVNLKTDDVDKTPTLKKLSITYSGDDQPLVSGNASVSPNTVTMGVQTGFTYNMNYTLAAGQNIKHAMILVPNYAVADSIYLSISKKVLYTPADFTTSSTNDSLYITFKTPVTHTSGSGMDNMKIYFTTSLLRNIHDFAGGVYNETMNDQTGILMLGENPTSTWKVTTTSAMDEVLSNVKVIPKVFTPNKDGVNDFTVIEFTLANVLSAHVKIKIFNTGGTLVATLKDEVISAGDKRIPDSSKLGRGNDAKSMPGYWDGRDDDNDLVPPGNYIYQVVVKTEDGDKIKSGTVTVAY